MSPIAFTDYISRTGAAAELPEQLASELIGAVQKESVMLSMARQVPTTTRDSRIPVVNSLPVAGWVSGTDPDIGLKSVTKMDILNQSIVAEELAAIAVIPDSVLADSEYNVWAAVRPELSKAIARAYDMACMFGVNAPTTFPQSLVAQATAAGNVVSGDTFATATDNAKLVLQAASLVATQGYNVNRACVSPGWQFRVASTMTTALANNPVGGELFPLILAGMPIRVNPLYWPAFATNVADAIVADWSLVLAGIRQDVQLTPFTEGVISDSTGKVITNLMMQDSTAVRATFRAGFFVATPPTGYTAATPSPIGLVKNTGTSFVPHGVDVVVESAESESKGAHAGSKK